MTKTKPHSPWPFFLLSALCALVPVLNNKYPASFFPVIPPFAIEVVMTIGGIYGIVIALSRWWILLQRKTFAQKLIMEVTDQRQSPEKPDENDVVSAGRYISRLVRNADEDLKEIKPDFTLESLGRLQRYLPQLLSEVEDEQSARITLGIVGVYLGETLCRNRQWQWFFRPAPDLKQFIYLASEIRKEGKNFDPFAFSASVLIGECSIAEVLKEIA